MKNESYSKYVWSSVIFTWAIMLIAVFVYKTTAMGMSHPGSWVLLALSFALLYIVREMLWIMWSPLGDTHIWRKNLQMKREKKRISNTLDWRAELRIHAAAHDPYFDVRQYCRDMVKDINRIRDVSLGLFA